MKSLPFTAFVLLSIVCFVFSFIFVIFFYFTMGCDGGTIPKRGELVRTKKKPEQKDKESELSFKWGHCSITQEPLQKPIVACQLGRLYNKTSVIEAILDQTKLPDLHKHIKNLRDVKELNLTDNPEFQKATETKDAQNVNIAPYICPLIGLEMNGRYRFIYFWSCGCVLSERALKVIKDNNCHKCQKPYTEDDIIVLNGTEEEKEILEKRMIERQNRLKAERKMKKSAKSEKETTATVTLSSNNEPSCSGLSKDGQVVTPNGTNKSKVTTEQNGMTKSKIALEQNGSKLKLPSKRPNGSNIEDPSFKKTRAEYSVAKDPKATEVFKSLFTSHKSAEKQTKAHWITYNPFYN